MSKRVFLIHGWEGKSEAEWRPWLRDKLQTQEFTVIIPAMPDTYHPTYLAWVNHLTKTVGKPTQDDILVGHSLGCITILRYLESLKKNDQINAAVLVAGFSSNLEYEGYNGELSSFLQKPLDWKKIKKHCKKFIAIHSDNDPYVPLKYNQIFKEKLAAESIVMHNMKHFSGSDGIIELPVVYESVLKLATLHS